MLYQYLQPAVAGSLFCSWYWMMLVQHDPRERYKHGFIHWWPEMCWVCSLTQTWWPGGSPLWCTSASHCHCVGDRACSWCSTSYKHILCSISMAVWAETAQVLHSFIYSLLCTGCWFGWHTSNWTQHEKARWVAGCAASSLLKRRTSSLSAMVLFFRFTPCCIFLI